MQKIKNKKKRNQEKFSTSVTNTPTLCQLIDPMDVSLSIWIHKKHEKELLTESLKYPKMSILSTMFDGHLVDT